ncbi:MAG TPA: NADH-quinone oxidoreductase subunit C [Bacteroidia bacterium]|nr:NADH-quinone oxidoreductase subunit C [Bacteroidota bacterium]MBP9789703.1 NADH-quinone oxidoreductase subunit C [Bacteroidia bacterium]HQW00214.1 NADH-quinone oxidoreductase subunit C [Bacteroidia bacterium]HQW22236.1 NADH-quinone oxidoreductase subunit C [Bacteroidia bacterium]
MIQGKLLSICPAAVFEENTQWPTMNIDSAEWRKLAEALKNENDLAFDYLFCVTCVDWKTHLTMVYHLSSTLHRHTIVVKAKIADRNNAIIDSVYNIWATAELNEREAYDLFGVHFTNHPDLRRLFLSEDWVGFPLRKDYEDPINMIKL